MSEIRQLLETMVLYYEKTRAVGHTRLMMKGLENEPAAVVVAGNAHHAREIKRAVPQCSPISVEGLSKRFYELAGVRLPIVFDNYALSNVFRMALEEIDRLEALGLPVEKG